MRELLCFSIVSWLRRLAKSAPKSEVVRRIGCQRCRQDLRHAVARERSGSQNREKLAGSEHLWKLRSVKCAPGCGARVIQKPKSSKHRGFGALFEVELRKTCTTLCRQSDLEVKIIENRRSRYVFGRSKCISRGRRRDFETLQNAWQEQDFVRVAKMLAGVVDLKRVRNDAFRVARAGIFVVCNVDV